MSREYKCKYCKDKGYTEYFPLDGMTIYHWMKPKKANCKHCNHNGRHD